MKIYGVAKLGPKGQVVIPSEARKDLGIQPGDKVVILSPTGKGILILPANEVKKYLVEMEKVVMGEISKVEEK